MLRGYREASRQSFMANQKHLAGWIWYSGLDKRTCVACWAMHGTHHPVTERMASHINCRCTMLPDVLDHEGFFVESGRDQFQRLDPADQEAILGPGKYDLYKSGKADITDMMQQKADMKWGASVRVNTLAQTRAVADSGGQRDFFRYGVKQIEPDLNRALQQQAEVARQKLMGIGAELNAEVGKTLEEMARVTEQHEAEWKIIGDPVHYSPTERMEASCRAKALTDRKAVLAKQYAGIAGKYTKRMRELMVVDRPSTVNITINDSRGVVTAKRKKDWKDGAQWFGRLVQRQVDEEAPFQYTPKNSSLKDRSFQSGGKVFMSRQDDKQATVVHELGHWLENYDQGARDAAQAFLRRRTAGEEEKSMADIFPTHGYSRSEVTRPDQFLHPYIGKNYGPTASEVTSMGVQYLYEDAYTFAKGDPDMFDFIFRMVRGGS